MKARILACVAAERLVATMTIGRGEPASGISGLTFCGILCLDGWIQPIGGEPPRQVSSFQSRRILAFEWSSDGKRYVSSQATESSHVALATDSRSNLAHQNNEGWIIPGGLIHPSVSRP